MGEYSAHMKLFHSIKWSCSPYLLLLFIWGVTNPCAVYVLVLSISFEVVIRFGSGILMVLFKSLICTDDSLESIKFTIKINFMNLNDRIRHHWNGKLILKMKTYHSSFSSNH